ncbi:unnamed protein product [Arctia plantaginis]|uniref:Angiotensin-converting enzyme n=1 Tax=Arctia plantaginis TaxID=874455 RepID=A0A8S1BQI2_ARCPL|nr:unnamed protein product [Arctia plantaginis]
MDTKLSLFLFIIIKTCLSENLDNLFQIINEETGKFNAIAANIAWESSINPGNPELKEKSIKYQRNRITWQQTTCDRLGMLYNSQLLNETQRRHAYLLCRGPKFTFNEARHTSNLYEELQSIYSDAEVCIPTESFIPIKNFSNIENAILNYLTNVKQFLNFDQDYILFAAKVAVNSYSHKQERLCLKGENDFEKMMEFSRNEKVLRWLWLTWREKVGPPMKEPYRRLVDVENQASTRNGYPNIGASWRDSLEMPRLRRHCRHLYESIKPLYKLLHAVVRFYLRWYYGEVVPKRGPIPAHLLGNLWSQNWEPLADLMQLKTIDLNRRMKELNWTVTHMVKRAEDFYQSLGLPAMTDKFWRESVMARDNNSKIRCHGTAADMFQEGDYRLLYCSETSKEDFYVLHHELGHIQYYMAYEHQPALFRQANAALHETIGDTIMYGVLTPQHLNRLGLINDSLLFTPNGDQTVDTYLDHLPDNDKYTANDEKIKPYEDTIKESSKTINDIGRENDLLKQKAPKLFDTKDLTIDMILLFKQALNKLPQIPFALSIDEYRWKYFEGSLERHNREFWNLVEELQGVTSPGKRGEEYFDVGAKFHVPDNTPYIRYFLSSFLQHQLFEKLCKAAVFGRRNVKYPVPDSIGLGRCDIYGSKAAGKILKDIMSRGHSQHWSEILQETVDEQNISSEALNRYYEPLYKVLDKFVRKHHVPMGW